MQHQTIGQSATETRFQKPDLRASRQLLWARGLDRSLRRVSLRGGRPLPETTGIDRPFLLSVWPTSPDQIHSHLNTCSQSGDTLSELM
ncbi:hypothetical protein BaRGS_00022968, partial [Batillaria attramentaria]